MLLRTIRFATLMLAAFSLSLSMTHLMEMPQRLQFDQDLWVNVTVVANVYALFGLIGAWFELGAILLAFILVFLVRNHRQPFLWSLGGAVLLLLAFISWLVFVADANAELARWLSAPVPPDWLETRNQWEYAHAANAIIKIVAFGSLVMSLLVDTPMTGMQERQVAAARHQ